MEVKVNVARLAVTEFSGYWVVSSVHPLAAMGAFFVEMKAVRA